MLESKSYLSDESLTRELRNAVRAERGAIANVIAHLVEFMCRRLFARAGYSSMHAYCVKQLGYSEQAAFKRVTAARAVRKFPELFKALADGRLHLTAIVLIAPHLRAESGRELVALASNRSRREIELLLASRFPKSDVPTRVEPIACPEPTAPELEGKCQKLSPGIVPDISSTPSPAGAVASPPTNTDSPASEQVEAEPAAAVPAPAPSAAPVSTPAPRLTPLSPGRFALQVTIDHETHELLRRAQDLAGFAPESRAVANILRRALESLAAQLEKRKFCATANPRTPVFTPPTESRTIPAWVKRAVWQRDGGRCTYVSQYGIRCESRRVEFDHIVPYAHGGEASVSNVRLLCRPHNQMAAEERFGEALMESRRRGSGERATGT